MAYEITDNETGETELLSERKAERKFGSVVFTEMVAGMNSRFRAVNTSIGIDEDFIMYDEGWLL